MRRFINLTLPFSILDFQAECLELHFSRVLFSVTVLYIIDLTQLNKRARELGITLYLILRVQGDELLFVLPASCITWDVMVYVWVWVQDVEVAVPTPKEGAMLVKVQACSVNPVDWRIQDGLLRPFLPKKFPYIPGIDVSGEVVSAGPGVVTFAPGDQILTCLDLRVWITFTYKFYHLIRSV